MTWFSHVSLLASLLLTLACRPATPQPEAASSATSRCPPLIASGWLNGSQPIDGNWLVIDCWAHWCVPCRRSAPQLIYLYDQWSARGVQFLGLTADGDESLHEIKTHLAHLRIPWAIGIGARSTLEDLGVDSLPTRLLVSPTGDICWRGADVRQLEVELERAVSQATRSAAPEVDAANDRVEPAPIDR